MKLGTPAVVVGLLLGAVVLAPSARTSADTVYSPEKKLGSGRFYLRYYQGDGYDEAWYSVGRLASDSRTWPGTTNVGLTRTWVCVGGEDDCNYAYLQAFNGCAGGDYTWTPWTFVNDFNTIVTAPKCFEWNYAPIDTGFVGMGN